MVRHSKKIEPFKYLKASLTLSITDKIKIDKRKQRIALMPNLVHSLDASSLCLLYNSFVKFSDDSNVNFYSVHDCYGVTAKNIDSLITHLRNIYIQIYSDKGYIYNFDEDARNQIIAHYGNDCIYNTEDRTITIGRKIIKWPKSPNISNKTVEQSYKDLRKSIWLVK
jgi:DNA-directed RNA polymerase